MHGERIPGPFSYVDKGSLAAIGRNYAIGRIGRLDVRGLPGFLIWAGVHILSLIGFRNRSIVLFEWAWAYLTRRRGARLITRPSDTEPRSAVHRGQIATR